MLIQPFRKNRSQLFPSSLQFCLYQIQSLWTIAILMVLGAFPALPLLAQSQPNSASEELTSTPLCQAELPRHVEAILSRPELVRSRWGMQVKTLPSSKSEVGDLLYDLNSHQYFIPASNVKLMTTAGVLLQWGANHRFQTPVYLSQSDAELNPVTRLRLVGQGDPSLSTEKLQTLVKPLQENNITVIDHLIVEETFPDLSGLTPSWEWDDIYYYYAPFTNSLILNENAVILTLTPGELGAKVNWNWSDTIAGNQWQIQNQGRTAPLETPYNIKIQGALGEPVLKITGAMAVNTGEDIWGMAIPNPAQYFRDRLAHLLEENEIKVARRSLLQYPPRKIDNEILLTTLESEPLAQLIQKTNQESNNLYAEALLRLLGTAGEEQNSLTILTETLTQLGVNPQSYRLKDGSGLSRQNLVSPEALVQTLELMARVPFAQVYQESLPVAGVTGTLRGRFLNTVLENNLKAKTGTLSGVSALSGYLQTVDKETLVFSILVNQSEQSSATLRQAIDEVILLFAVAQDCE